GNDRLDLSRLARWFISSAELATSLRSSATLGEIACFSSRLSARMHLRSQKRCLAAKCRLDGEGISQRQGSPLSTRLRDSQSLKSLQKLSCCPAVVETKAA